MLRFISAKGYYNSWSCKTWQWIEGTSDKRQSSLALWLKLEERRRTLHDITVFFWEGEKCCLLFLSHPLIIPFSLFSSSFSFLPDKNVRIVNSLSFSLPLNSLLQTTTSISSQEEERSINCDTQVCRFILRTCRILPTSLRSNGVWGGCFSASLSSMQWLFSTLVADSAKREAVKIIREKRRLWESSLLLETEERSNVRQLQASWVSAKSSKSSLFVRDFDQLPVGSHTCLGVYTLFHPCFKRLWSPFVRICFRFKVMTIFWTPLDKIVRSLRWFACLSSRSSLFSLSLFSLSLQSLSLLDSPVFPLSACLFLPNKMAGCLHVHCFGERGY